MADHVLEERLDRALTAFLRQELQAPATAVTDFLDIIIEDARTTGLNQVLADLDRMHAASLKLNSFVKSVLEDNASQRRSDESFDAFNARLRHDLRNPLNAIKGYSEMLIEDMQDDESSPLLADLRKLRRSADQLIGQVDSMVALGRAEAKELGEARMRHLDVVTNVLRTVQPIGVGNSRWESIPSSRILVVDDNAANRDVLARRMIREGHQVVTADSGSAALAQTTAQPFDLILLDLIMPDMGGYEVLRRLKADESTREIPVVIVSALDELDSVVRCIEAGAEDYLTKPFNPILLRARIGACLEKKWLHDREKQFLHDLEREKQRSESLLLNILPPSIVDRMRNGEMIIADRVTEATVLFCDLVGFTSMSERLPADKTIDVLSQIFTKFDRLAAEHGAEKIKTIGDAYMLAGGIPETQPDHALRIARLAPRMLEAVEAVGDVTDVKLQARIGIHTGALVAGVIGTHKFVYDVWGDTVNTASRMESHSLPGRIQVSEAMRDALGEEFKFEPRGKVQIRGKGAMETFFLMER